MDWQRHAAVLIYITYTIKDQHDVVLSWIHKIKNYSNVKRVFALRVALNWLS